MQFDAETVQSVVEHMNSDHADACLAIVRAFSDYSDAYRAEMTDIDSQAMTFSTVPASGEQNHEPVNVRIAFHKELRDASQIRGMLVAMTKQAKAAITD